ncbi:hypothetical protein AB0M94_27465 [Streptomyces xanthochromogenes]|uniref:hypothetical protein n=1 Tax=Streptomyces xanthochromogenes TaxID=67384 RepID=UPI00343CE6FF
MTSPATPRSPGLPLPATTGRENATIAPAHGPVVRQKDDAEGVLSVLPFTVLTEQDTSTAATAWAAQALDVKMPFRSTPTARSTCTCGRDRTAQGAQEVRALIDDHAHHRTECPLLHAPERRPVS